MARLRHARPPWPAAMLALLLAVPAPAVAVTDSTPPQQVPGAGYEAWHEWRTGLIHLRSAFTDPETGVPTIVVSCDGGPEASYPYTPEVTFAALEPAAGGCGGYGPRNLTFRLLNGAGVSTHLIPLAVQVIPSFTLEYPLPAETGRPFTVRPRYSPGFTPPPDAVCRWEVRWGSVRALRDNAFDETFGGMLFEGTASQGFCGEWTFTLPWVPEPRFEFNLDAPAADVRTSIWPDRNLVMASIVGTDRRIYQSTLPVAQVLPSTYTPIVGQPITYTRYLIGGATATAADGPRWSARLGDGERPIVWEKETTSSTFTITPPAPGPLFVGWDRSRSFYRLGAYYDPPVRYADLTAPDTTPPVQRIAGSALGSTVPVSLTWTGSDRGWGIASYRLQQSVDGGPWQTVVSATTARSVTRHLAPWRTYRFRVRAVDRAGNVGLWDYGPSFRPRIVQDGSSSIAYARTWTSVTDPSASGGTLRESTAAGATATLRFVGRDVAWVAERGPGHGRVKVYVDGAYVTTVDLLASADAPARIVFRRHWGAAGTHTIRLVGLATAGRPLVDLDAFIVLR